MRKLAALLLILFFATSCCDGGFDCPCEEKVIPGLEFRIRTGGQDGFTPQARNFFYIRVYDKSGRKMDSFNMWAREMAEDGEYMLAYYGSAKDSVYDLREFRYEIVNGTTGYHADISDFQYKEVSQVFDCSECWGEEKRVLCYNYINRSVMLNSVKLDLADGELIELKP